MGESVSIGIDLGTTNSCAAIQDGDRPRVIKSSLGYATIPSVLTYSREGALVVGQQAERQMVLRPHDCIYGSKRLLGRNFSSGARDRFQPHFAYPLTGEEGGYFAAQICEQTIPLVEVSAKILVAIREAAESALGQRVGRAVITVPAYFNENQREMVRQAGRLAELEVLRIINEPTAAVLCFGVRGEQRRRVLVFDLGGGTFDVSIIEIAGGQIGVVGVDGDTFLGGLDFDQRLALIARQKLSQRRGREVTLDAVGQARVMLAVRTAKHELSEQPSARLEIRALALGDGSMVNVEEVITAAEYLHACRDLLDRLALVVKRALDRARLQPREIDDVLLVGGQTRMPAVRQLIRDLFGKEPNKRVHPDEAVALGAAIAAEAHLRQDATLLLDMLPMPIGTAATGGQFLPVIPRNTRLPVERSFLVRVPAGGGRLRLPLFQGDGGHVFDNESLGAVDLEALLVRRKGGECTVTLRFDDQGRFSVWARGPRQKRDQEVQLDREDPPNELLEELARAAVEIVVPETPAAEEQVSAGPAFAGSARREGAEPEPTGWWSRLWGWLRGA